MFQKKNYMHTKLSKLEKLRCEKYDPTPLSTDYVTKAK